MGSIVSFQRPESTLLLRVTTGIHAGVSLPLESQQYRVGSESGCDLTLGDKDVAGHHLTLQKQGNDLLVEAVGGDVTVDDDTSVPAGHGLRCSLPCTLQFGNAALNLATAAPEKSAQRKMPRASWIAIGGAALSLLTIAAVQAGVGDLLVSNPTPAAQVSALKAEEAGALPGLVPGGPVEAALKTKLQQVGLADLKVDADGTRLTVAGDLDKDRRKVWNDVQGWFDRTYGGTFVLTSLVGMTAPKVQPRFNLQAVWFGETPYAISSDGTRLYKGAALEDGWIIKDIRDGRLIAGRQDEEFVLTF
ncbi:hypothetical protein M8997_013870 [Phyllobacterium sp. 21LDTY02-6]|uniref:SctD/MshK family protein n=1 Tax=unclassified Phyllobacterium TaxID=2638441 RepID=UPI002020A1C1|nr:MULTISPECIES: FHA domain-containing protein [unclassified Phyllobacterium]MCO4318278.1 hypothetical protein [Phyllobacterium sp. 21LDTY02-6]MCX8280273.1 hypothetical protein [Phyllobacterium sp. 0TCS1.6C]MCX8294166.1 hypothetical protein [Phyllobacterium sp. 0TCS1.6A]